MEVLKQGKFLRLWIAQVISQLGDSVVGVAILWLVAVHTHGGYLVGLVLFAQLLPTTLVGPFAGPFADKWSPRWLMVGADLYRMVIVLFMVALQNDVWALLGLIFMLGFGTALFTPARSAAVPQLVGDELIPQATAISQGTWSVMGIAGPALGGVFLALHQTKLIFAIDAASFLMSAVLIATLRSLRGLAKDTGVATTYTEMLSAGVRQVVDVPALRFLLFLFTPIAISAGMFSTDYTTVLLQFFHVARLHYGLLDSVFSGGLLVGALASPFLLSRVRPGLLLLTMSGCMGVSMVLVEVIHATRGHSSGLIPLYIWSVFVGFFNATINVPLGSLFVGITPAAFRARTGALLQAVANGGMMAGILLGGWFSSLWNALTATAAAGIIMLLAAIVFPWLKGYRELHAVPVRESRKQKKQSAARSEIEPHAKAQAPS